MAKKQFFSLCFSPFQNIASSKCRYIIANRSEKVKINLALNVKTGRSRDQPAF